MELRDPGHHQDLPRPDRGWINVPADPFRPCRSAEGFEVTAFEPVSRLAMQGQLGPFWTRASYLLEPNGSAKRLVNEMDIEAPSAAQARCFARRVTDQGRSGRQPD